MTEKSRRRLSKLDHSKSDHTPCKRRHRRHENNDSEMQEVNVAPDFIHKTAETAAKTAAKACYDISNMVQHFATLMDPFGVNFDYAEQGRKSTGSATAAAGTSSSATTTTATTSACASASATSSFDFPEKQHNGNNASNVSFVATPAAANKDKVDQASQSGANGVIEKDQEGAAGPTLIEMEKVSIEDINDVDDDVRSSNSRGDSPSYDWLLIEKDNTPSGPKEATISGTPSSAKNSPKMDYVAVAKNLQEHIDAQVKSHQSSQASQTSSMEVPPAAFRATTPQPDFTDLRKC